MQYYVTRQHYWNTNFQQSQYGADAPEIYSVEIVRGRDSIGPDMLVERYGHLREGEGFDDPRAAVATALTIRNTWMGDYNTTHPDNPAEFEVTRGEFAEYTDEEIIAWAEKEYKKLPKCDACGDILGDETYRWEDETYCSEYCLDRATALSWDDEEEYQVELALWREELAD